MSGDYSTKRYRKMRQVFREECRRNRVPCSICFQPINYALTWPDKAAWELHHVKPSSTHPHLHYVQANWAASHASCNAGQGNKPRQEWVQPTW